MIYGPDISVRKIREQLSEQFGLKNFVQDKSGVKCIELISAGFTASEPAIFGEVNQDYVYRELEWYKSQSLNVNDIPGGPPSIWVACGSKGERSEPGFINSNYGYLIFSKENGNQYDRVKDELRKNPDSRRAVMIYTRPTIWNEYNLDGMSDFICTNSVQYVIRRGRLYGIVQMRSNDAWAGYRNDFAWQRFVLYRLAGDLNVEAGHIFWNAGSLHLYERQFYLVDHYLKTDRKEWHITKKKYDELYPGSEWASAVSSS